ncbi:hypothetical protein HGRIS_006327 [Hohenbuehelia grisea]|uniref:Xylanolytic transcriptional activator regulatory domain-containing protein n=1 Tax=Hohenbuehelia grisea TaxID=104357 RepID=A0ABR3K0W6_9AGAR
MSESHATPPNSTIIVTPMPDSILTVALDESRDALPPPRPLKRQRKPHNADTHTPPPHDVNQYNQAPAQLDHIFIADGIANKKGAKKVHTTFVRRMSEAKTASEYKDSIATGRFRVRRAKSEGAQRYVQKVSSSPGKVHALTIFLPCTRNRNFAPSSTFAAPPPFILANTEQLHSKIIEMSDRIRHLEEALEALQATCSSEPHPLLANPDWLNIKSAMGLYGGTQTGSSGDKLHIPTTGGTGANGAGVNGHSDGHGRGHSSMSPGSEEEKHDIRRMDVDTSVTPERDARMTNGQQHHHTPDYSSEVMRLSERFPLSETVSPEPNPRLREYIRGQLPSREEAAHLWEQARSNALWQYNPHPNETFLPNLLHHVYTSSIPDLCPRRLALLLMILAVGSLVDLTQPPTSPCAEGVVAERFHHLARAALCEIPVMEETNTDTITALFYEIWYLLVFSDKKKAAGYAFGLMGLTARLAQSIGLHREGSKSKMIPEEVEKRRSLFWELMYLDARLSLSLGRPPSLFLNHVDCKRPSYQPDEGCDPAESLHYFQEWKHSSYITCLSPVLEVVSSPPSALNYEVVIDLDRRIRDFTVPPPLRSGETQSRQLMMQKASLSTALEAVLLQLHRTFFTRALSGPERAFNRRHPFAPSVVAVFLSASRMIATVEALFRHEPALTARILAFWSNAFSAAPHFSWWFAGTANGDPFDCYWMLS